MGKSYKSDMYDTEYRAYIDQLNCDYSDAQETIEKQKKDILTLVSLLIANDIAVPGSIIDKYIKRLDDTSTNDISDDEELPFN